MAVELKPTLLTTSPQEADIRAAKASSQESKASPSTGANLRGKVRTPGSIPGGGQELATPAMYY